MPTLSSVPEGRILFLTSAIDKRAMLETIAFLRKAGEENPSSPVFLVLDSSGGDVVSGWAIIDCMKLCACPVWTVCLGECDSMAAVIFANGAKGGRIMLPHAKLMIHQPWGNGAFGIRESEMRLASEQMSKTRAIIEESLSKASGLSLDEVHSLCEKDFYMSAEESVSLGFADRIL